MTRVPSSTDKLASVDQARERMERWRAAGERVVFVSGAFDLLDVGTLRALAEARAGAERLVVVVWGDAAARSLLGPGRPLLAATDRAMLVAALRAVDVAVVCDEPSVEQILGILESEWRTPTSAGPSGPRAGDVAAATPASDLVARIRERLGRS